MNLDLPAYIALAGPTASGKTAAALAIAHHVQGKIPVEIISVDSALVYKGMDIGTAKPSAAELAAVPHHLIDIRDPIQPYSAAEFAKDTARLMTEITLRGHLPLLVGGTMLYFKALLEGLDDMPSANAEIRAAIELEAAQLGWPAMHAQLAAIDALTAARLKPMDAQRIQRALEVYRISGQPLSSFHKSNHTNDETDIYTTKNIANYAINTTAISKFISKNSLFISLEPNNRAWLHERIAQRFDLMLQSGFEQEVRALRERGDLTLDTPSIRCVGYRQMWEALEAMDAMHDGKLDKKTAFELREKGIAATRQLCKRQLTWLRSMPHRQVVACDAPDAVEQVIRMVNPWLLNPS